MTERRQPQEGDPEVGGNEPIEKIALEEHFCAPGLEPSIEDVSFFDPDILKGIERQLVEISEQRLQLMDRSGIAIAVLSQTAPGVQSLRDPELAAELAKRANQFLKQRINAAPDRFRGFACVALQDVGSACDALRWCVEELGFVGALVNSSTCGMYLDEPHLAPFWSTLERLNVPLYLHPGLLPDRPLSFRGHPELEGAVWGWTCDTAAHALRLVFAGVFDRHPGARVILGHMGETLPYMLWRLDSRAAITPIGRRLSRVPSETLRHHVLVTTSGVCADPPLRCALMALGDDAVMFATDHPYEDCELAARWIENASISEAQRLRICTATARRVLRLG